MPVFTYTTDSNWSCYRPFTGWTDPERVDPVAVSHRKGCPMGDSGWPDTSRESLSDECRRHGCSVGYKLTRFTGKVLKLREANHYHDSDFFALVWTNDGPKEVEYASTRGWTYFNGAEIDATEEVLSAYKKWQDKLKAERVAAEQKRADARASIRDQMPRFGQSWRIKSRRSKVPHGTIVEVADEPLLSSYAYPLRFGESLEERWQSQPSDVAVKIRLPNGSFKTVSASVLDKA